MSEQPEQTKGRGSWATQWGFILAAIGSAIGLGNVWRFPYMAYSNGGFAFLVPYIIGLFVIGLPLLILEFGTGHHMKGSAPLTFRNIHRRFGWIGWWAVTFVMFGVVVYYAAVISWCANYFCLSFGRSWGSDPAVFFNETFLQMTDKPTPEAGFGFGGVVWWVLGGLALVWLINWFITAKEIHRGIEKASRIFIPLLLVVVTILVVWSLTFEGARQGLSLYFNPAEANWDKLSDPSVWVNSISQIFFTLSVGFGIMIAYASYLPPDANVAKSAIITALGNCGFSIFAGVAVFATIGFIAASHHVPIKDLEEAQLVQATEEAAGEKLLEKLPEEKREMLQEGMSAEEAQSVMAENNVPESLREEGIKDIPLSLSGPGLVFKTYPITLNKVPGGTVFAILFFAALFVAGLSSSVSIVEAFSSALRDHFNISRMEASTGLCLVAFLGGIPFATGGGLFLLDVVDHFLLQYGLVIVGIFESIIVGWYFTTRRLRSHIDEAADIKFSHRGDVMMRVVLTVFLGLTWFALARTGDTEGIGVKSIGTHVAMLALLATIFIVWIEEHWLDFNIKFVIPALLIFIVNGSLIQELQEGPDGGFYNGYQGSFVLIGVIWLVVSLAVAGGLEKVSKMRLNANAENTS